jgi:hypothetical protein
MVTNSTARTKGVVQVLTTLLLLHLQALGLVDGGQCLLQHLTTNLGLAALPTNLFPNLLHCLVPG